jgi:hypothetical protein
MIGVLLAFGVLASSCYGPFELTRKLYKWNGHVGDKWVNEGVFLLLNIIPVYGAATFVDAVVLNSVKFWTGKSALASRLIEQGGLKAVLTPEKDGKLVRLEIFRNGTPVQTAVIRADADGSLQAYTLDGGKLVSRTLGDGTVELSRADGTVVAAYPAAAAGRYPQ